MKLNKIDSLDEWFIDRANDGSVQQRALQELVDNNVLSQSKINFGAETEQMKAQGVYERRGPSGYKQLQDLILDYLSKHPDGLLEIELRKLFEGAAIAFGHDADSVSNAIKALEMRDAVFALEEDFEWPQNSGWSTPVKRIRPTFDAWVKAVS